MSTDFVAYSVCTSALVCVTFTFDDWKRHRSSNRYLYHLKTLSESGIVRGIAAPVLFVTAFTAGMTLLYVVAALNVAHAARMLPAWLPPLPNIAIEPIQLTSIALSLLLHMLTGVRHESSETPPKPRHPRLLTCRRFPCAPLSLPVLFYDMEKVFRTNASYSRWDEGRRSFGSITTVSRDIARQAFAWFRTDDMTNRSRLGRWLVALGRVTMVHLREEHGMQEELKGVLKPQEIDAVTSSIHAPSFCLQMITWTIRTAGLPQELVIRMDENVSRLTDAVSACERILNTPIPLSYTRHTARFLMAWLVCLPFCLWSYCGLAMVPIAALVAFVLLGIEEIGVYIEEPFSILALEKLVNKLENIVNAMLRESQWQTQSFALHILFVGPFPVSV
ncbi:hypothetical protein VOLCADRAFT_97891 [Volvox carteri f. nagariensis]|uniref:Uncharacterized protein n=1 Tax=Volvox carteri f. nagariensis TaxID=3068 RepID=D8UDX4_VOLCA|nr:uncharacterized protein VOLCADRAFT_97891 [Volvox carteri f. nagariensis]EFJ42121.1 hypothetical protein VOLCADRAFT_97891 [Volvox carteri f. nagariensis]|eukprot:XP_002956818.1 hypothetical protein VOLCADRAFT_97891 [Volvox carteri f. nagariensis]